MLSPDVRRQLLGHPERLEEWVAAGPENGTFVIDEVQRVPELLDVVHKLLEERPSLRFVLTGSSARKLKRTGGVDLLAGRAVQRFCHPFLASEMGRDFSLARALRWGMVPLVAGLPDGDAEDVLRTYLDLYVQEEVASEGIVRNPGGFARFLEAASFAHGSVLSASAVARDCGVKRSTVDGYFAILEDMLLTARLPVFAKRAKRALVSHDKFYFFDCGVFRALRPKGPMDNPNELTEPVWKGWFSSICGPGGTIRADGSACTTGGPRADWKWTLSYTGRMFSRPSRSKTPLRSVPGISGGSRHSAKTTPKRRPSCRTGGRNPLSGTASRRCPSATSCQPCPPGRTCPCFDGFPMWASPRGCSNGSDWPHRRTDARHRQAHRKTGGSIGPPATLPE